MRSDTHTAGETRPLRQTTIISGHVNPDKIKQKKLTQKPQFKSKKANKKIS